MLQGPVVTSDRSFDPATSAGSPTLCLQPTTAQLMTLDSWCFFAGGGPPGLLIISRQIAVRGIQLGRVETEAAFQRFARAGPGRAGAGAGAGPGPGRAVAGGGGAVRSGLGGVAGAWLLRRLAARLAGGGDAGTAGGMFRDAAGVRRATGSMEHRAAPDRLDGASSRLADRCGCGPAAAGWAASARRGTCVRWCAARG